MHGISAKIAQEIGMLFENGDWDTSARQQEAEHHPGRTSADNAAGGFHRRHGLSLRSLNKDKNRALVWFHVHAYACLSGVLTDSPSRSSVTLIWHDRREFGRTS